MNKILSRFTFCAMLFLVVTNAQSQVEVVSSNYMNYVDSTDRVKYRMPEAGDVAVVINSTLNSSQFFDQVGPDILNEEESGINRLVEQFAPSYRYYLTSKKCVSVGFLLSRKTQSVMGATTDTIEENLEMSMKSRSVSIRLAYDKHNKPIFFRHFDLDTYFGAAISIGKTKSEEKTNQDYSASDYSYLQTTTPSNAAGGELYTGIALRFDVITIGVEVLALGFDHQWGFGASEVEYDYLIDGSSDSGVYFVNSGQLPSQFSGEYSSLNARSTTTSMYRGIRLNLVLHLK
jgi:hypothetical protein